MGMQIVTPGHNIVTDSLIMWGIVSLLLGDACNTYESYVEGIAGRYRIVIKDFKSQDFIRNFEQWVDRNIPQLSQAFSEKKRKSLGKYLAGRELSRKLDADTRGGVVDAVRRIYKEKHILLELGSIFQENHIYAFGEGRGGRTDFSAYVPISGIYGKYLTEPFEYKDKPYKLCELCLLFASIGLEHAGICVKKGAEMTYGILGFNGITQINNLGFFVQSDDWRRGGERILRNAIGRYDASLTAMSKMFIMLASIPSEDRHKVPHLDWYMTIFSYEAGGAKRVTSFHTFNINVILDFIERIEREYGLFYELISLLLSSKDVIQNGGDDAINILSELSYTRNLELVNKFLRTLRVITDRTKGGIKDELLRKLSRNLAKALMLSCESYG